MAERLILSSLGGGKNQAALTDNKIVGGKSAGLAKMTELGLKVPPYFTITTDASRFFNKTRKLPEELTQELVANIKLLEQKTGKVFGDKNNPLLVSVRSGAPVSMPGMMETVLNLGLNQETVVGLSNYVGAESALDCYCLFLSMYGRAVFEIAEQSKSDATTNLKLDEQKLRQLCLAYKNAFQQAVGGYVVPNNPYEQLMIAIKAVMESWNSERARAYRKTHNIPNDLGTAVIVQQMVYGNCRENSGAGVVFSRNVSTGENELYGEFIKSAQGEGVVSGTRTPEALSELKKIHPKIYKELQKIAKLLERSHEDIVEIEFTVQNGELYILQCRAAKKTAEAAAVFAVQMVQEKQWSKLEAVQKMVADYKFQEEHLELDEGAVKAKKPAGLYAEGLPASPGAAVGVAVFSSTKAIALKKSGAQPILIRPDTSPDDLPGMLSSLGIVTGAGGTTCHAAVVARDLAKPAVVGVKNLRFNGDSISCGKLTIKEGDIISIDGSRGVMISGKAPCKKSSNSKAISTLLSWLKEAKPQPPKLRISFEHFGGENSWYNKRFSINQLINDFYIAEAMNRKAKGTPLQSEAEKLQWEISKKTAEILLFYLAVAVSGELRHYGYDNDRDEKVQKIRSKNFLYLRDNFYIEVGGERAAVQHRTISVLCGVDVKEQIKFFQAAVALFNSVLWEGGYGGRAWAKIAKAPLRLLRGEVGIATFVDHIFDLQHNGDCLFDKHSCVANLTKEDNLAEQLNIKKSAKNIDSLFNDLLEISEISQEVYSLWEKGRGAGLWEKEGDEEG